MANYYFYDGEDFNVSAEEIAEDIMLTGMSDEELDAYAYAHAAPLSDEDDYSSNAPCDTSGFCAGSSCPYYGTCFGG